MFTHRMSQTARVALGAFAVISAAACSGGTDPFAQFDNVTFKSSLYAINGTPIGVPSAINTGTGATVRAEASYDFDVAFDLDNQGRVVVITQRLVGRPIGISGHAVSLQLAGLPFDAFTSAPRDGWVVDSLLTVDVGQVFAVRAQTVACQFTLSTHLYSKMIVDSVDVPNRRMWLTTLADPNCGFRELVPGRPRF
jgi:hypothetical protein